MLPPGCSPGDFGPCGFESYHTHQLCHGNVDAELIEHENARDENYTVVAAGVVLIVENLLRMKI